MPFNHAPVRISSSESCSRTPTDGKRNRLNRALFETWGCVLADYPREVVASHRDELVRRARVAMTDDAEFIAAISVGTGDPRNVKLRFEKVSTIAREVLDA